MNNISDMTASVNDRAAIHRQLEQAKETLTRLRTANGHQNGTSVAPIPPREATQVHNASFDSVRGLPGDEHLEGCNRYGEIPARRQERAERANDNLVRVLGLEATKMEDDLKVALLAHFEQVERQKEDLISSFEVMHGQLRQHQDAWEEKRRESERKDDLIRRLRTSNEALKNTRYTSATGDDENGRLKALTINGERYGIHDPNDELYENLMKENKYLRDRLKEQQTRELERKRQLLESYDNDVTKDATIKRLQVENRGMQEAMEDLQNELLRRNADRVLAEKEVAKVSQEMQFCEEQIRCLRDKLQQAIDEKRYLEDAVQGAKGQAILCDGNLSLLQGEINGLREKCETYRDKLHDKEEFATSVKKENQRLGKVIDALKKELASARNETRTLKKEGVRLHEEVAEREIDRLSTETRSEASSSKIKSLNEQLHQAEKKAIELSEACRESEEREAKLSQETLAAIEKYTRAEEELFTAKKELAHVKGFYDGTENRRKQLQDEIDTLRSEKASLQEKLKSSHKFEDDKIVRDKARLTERNDELEDEIKSLSLDVKKLEEALENARDKDSIKSMRLDGMETMMDRKDERIKALQAELLDRHNQTDSLADELLVKNRETENLKVSMMMLEQELEALKTGGAGAKRALRESSGSYPGEPATPDSGIADLDREKAIERLRKDMLPEHFSKSPRQVRGESGFRTIDEALNEGSGGASVGDHEVGRSIPELATENDDSKTREAELRNAVSELERKLSEAVRENEGLKLREQELQEALEAARNNAAGEPDEEPVLQDEQVLPVEYLSNLCAAPEEFYDAVDSTEADNRLETVPEETWTDLESVAETVDGRHGNQYLEEENGRLKQEIGELEATVKDWESSLEELTEEKQALSEELDTTQANLQRVRASVAELQQENDELQAALEREIAARAEDGKKWQEQLKDSDEMNDKHKAALEEAEELCHQKEQEVLGAQAENLALSKECLEHRERVENLEKFLEQGEQFAATLQAELGEATEKIRRNDSENAQLRQNMDLAFQEKEGLEGRFRENVRVQKETEDNLTALFNENQELHQQLQAAHDNIRELETARQRENDAARADSEDARNSHERKIDELHTELAHSREKMEDLKLTWKNSHDEKSDLKNDLLEARERIYEAATANDILVRRGNELERCLFEKEEQAEKLRTEKDEARAKREEGEKRLGELDKELEHLKQQANVMSRENESLRGELKELQTDKIELENLTSILENEKKIVDDELQETHESISDLERALEQSEDDRVGAERNLEETQKGIDALREALMAAEGRVQELESENKAKRDELKSLQVKLMNEEKRAAESRSELERVSEKVAALEQDKDESQGKEYLLHERLLNALNKVNEKEAECNDSKEREHALEADVMQLKTKGVALEREKETVEVIRMEAQQELMAVQGDFTTLQEQLSTAQAENEGLQGELKRLQGKIKAAEGSLEQSVEDNDALRAEIREARAKMSELEASINAKQSRVEDLEDWLSHAQSKERGLEERLQESMRKKDEQAGRLEELNHKLRASKDDCSSLERKLKKQKETAEELKKDLVNNQDKLYGITRERDSAESSLHSARTELTRKEGKLKAQKEHLQQAELDLDQAARKAKELEANNRKACRKNEDLLREVHDMKDKVARLENANAHKEAMVGRLEASLLGETPTAATKRRPSDDRLRNLGDKLSIAQIKLADLETDIAKEIRRHELRSVRGRPLSALSASSDGKDPRKKPYLPRSKDNSFDSQKTEELLTQSDAESVGSNDKGSRKAGESQHGEAGPANFRGGPPVHFQEIVRESPALPENQTRLPSTAEISALRGADQNGSKRDLDSPISNSRSAERRGLATDSGEAVGNRQADPVGEANSQEIEAPLRHEERNAGDMRAEGRVGEEALVVLQSNEEYHNAPGEFPSRGWDGEETGAAHRSSPEPEHDPLGLPPGELLRSDSSTTSVTEATTHRSSELDLDGETSQTRTSTPEDFMTSCARLDDVTPDVTADVTDVIDPFMELMQNPALIPPADYADDDFIDPFAEMMTYSSPVPPSTFVSGDVHGVSTEEFGEHVTKGPGESGAELELESWLRDPLVPQQEACKVSNVVNENEYGSPVKKPSLVRKQPEAMSGKSGETDVGLIREGARQRPKPEVPRKPGKLAQNREARLQPKPQHSEARPTPKPRLKKAQKQKTDEAGASTATTDAQQDEQADRESVFDLIAAFEERKV